MIEKTPLAKWMLLLPLIALPLRLALAGDSPIAALQAEIAYE
jgi:hypothetical protein